MGTVSVFPWKKIFNKACRMGDRSFRTPYSLINWYYMDLIDNRSNRWVNNPNIDHYLRKEYNRYNNVCPPMKFDINKDEFCDRLIKHYLSRDTPLKNAVGAANGHYDLLITYERLPEIKYQLYPYIKIGNEPQLIVISEYLQELNGSTSILSIGDYDIDDIMELELDDKLKFLGIKE